MQRLRPSEIYFSHDTICSSFSNSRGIGLVVDDICAGRDSIDNIPAIDVARVGSKWFAADNRRLWVFKKLEARGRCNRISVNVIDSIPDGKMTTKNGGKSVDIRGDPYESRTPRRSNLDDSDDCSYDSDYY